jgi:hypothetical protein
MNKGKLEKRVWFTGYARALAQGPRPQGRREMCRGIPARSLHECKERQSPLGVASARRFMRRVERGTAAVGGTAGGGGSGRRGQGPVADPQGMRNPFRPGRDSEAVRSRSWLLSARLLPACTRWFNLPAQTLAIA